MKELNAANQQKLKILIIRSHPSYLDVTNRTYNIQELGLAKALNRKGFKCDILFWTNQEEKEVVVSIETGNSVKVFYRHGISLLGNVIYKSCNKLLEEYDILQTNEYNQVQSWILANRYPHKTVVYHGPYYCAFNKRYNLMCKFFDAFFLNSYIKNKIRFITKSVLAKDFLLSKGIATDNITSIGVGIDTQMLECENAVCEDELYKILTQDKSEIKLLYIGRFEKRRNVHFIIDIFRNVLSQNTSARLYMIGTGETEYINSVFSYANQCGIRDKIIWQESMQQKYLSLIYKETDYFLLPTEYEIFGMVLLEAMYFGNVVLTTKNGGAVTLIENGKNGFIIEGKNAEIWAKCILDLDSNADARKSIQNSASKIIKERFTWCTLVDSFMRQYKVIVK